VEYLIRPITKAMQTGLIKYSTNGASVNEQPSTQTGESCRMDGWMVGAGWMVGGWETVFN